ncbi:MAG: tetratricopeptide repeat protein [Bacteroidales bacterium]|nr:tetratricopeptide repeat protein [Bacteroidales bacterium]
MEILKKTGIILFAICISNSMAFSQDIKAVQDAFAKSYTYEKNKEYSKASDELKKVYAADNYYENLRLGWLNYLAGQYTESIKYYQSAINIMPYSIEAKLGYIYPASALGNWEQVKTQYNEILKIDEKNSSANYNMGYIYYNKQDYANALKYFEKVVNLYPFDYNSLLMFAWTNLKLGNFREAKVLFGNVLLLSPDDKSALEGLGMIK